MLVPIRPEVMFYHHYYWACAGNIYIYIFNTAFSVISLIYFCKGCLSLHVLELMAASTSYNRINRHTSWQSRYVHISRVKLTLSHVLSNIELV